MPVTVRPAELIELLSHAIPAIRPILITGPPGIGKTSIVEQAAQLCDADVIISHPVVADPTDVKGLPWVVPGASHASFFPFGDAYRALNAKKLTVWVLDDLGQAMPSVQASYMQPILGRQINGERLPDCLTFVAATNRRTDRAGVTGILEPVKSRFASIVELAVNLDDWCTWAFAHNLPAELIAFLRFKTNLLCEFNASADLTNSPVPRTWAHVAQLMALNLSPNVMHAAIIGAVGEGAAVEFAGFRRLYATLPSIDGILIDPKGQPLPKEMSTLYAVVTALGMKANENNFPRIAVYAERLTKANHGEFATLLLRDAVKRAPKIMQTGAFIALASSELGQLIAGGV